MADLDCEGEILYDHSGKQNHGTIVGPSWEEIIPGLQGCPYAENYNENANLEDESCFGYPENGEYSISFDGTDDFIGQIVPSFNMYDQFSFGIKFETYWRFNAMAFNNKMTLINLIKQILGYLMDFNNGSYWVEIIYHAGFSIPCK